MITGMEWPVRPRRREKMVPFSVKVGPGRVPS